MGIVLAFTLNKCYRSNVDFAHLGEIREIAVDLPQQWRIQNSGGTILQKPQYTRRSL